MEEKGTVLFLMRKLTQLRSEAKEEGRASWDMNSPEASSLEETIATAQSPTSQEPQQS